MFVVLALRSDFDFDFNFVAGLLVLLLLMLCLLFLLCFLSLCFRCKAAGAIVVDAATDAAADDADSPATLPALDAVGWREEDDDALDDGFEGEAFLYGERLGDRVFFVLEGRSFVLPTILTTFRGLLLMTG